MPQPQTLRPNEFNFERVTVGNTLSRFCILLEYDGPKEEVSIDDNILLLWEREFEDFERWHVIFSDKNLLEEYLHGNLGILSLMKKSSVFIGIRHYDKYEQIENLQKIDEFSFEPEIRFPKRDVKMWPGAFEFVAECLRMYG